MTRGKSKGQLSSRIFYIIVSVIFAFALWLYVESNVNYIEPFTVNNVPVTRINEEVLADRGLLVSSMSPETVTLTFECSRSVATRLNNNTLSAVIDLANITRRGFTTIRFEVSYPEGITADAANPVSRSVDRISLNIDEMETRQVNVTVPYRGGVAEGFMQDTIEYDPREITVSGPASVVSRVSAARVNVVRENLSATYTEDLGFTLLDENGEEFDEALRNQLSVSTDSVHVTIPIRVEKEVALIVEWGYGAGATAQNTTYAIDPPTITIAAEPDVARDLNSISLGSINLTDVGILSDTQTKTIQLPNNVTNVSGETQAIVTFEMTGLEIRHFSVTNIFAINAPAGYSAERRTQSVDVRIRGTPADMENLTVDDIRVVADVSQLGPGTQQVGARVYIDGFGDDIGAIGSNTITVAIVRDT